MKMITIAFLTLSILHSISAVPLMEGDIVVTADLIATMTGRQNNAYDGILKGHWTGGVVPYTFHSKFPQESKEAVYDAISQYDKYTCVRLVPRTNQKNYVYFINGGGCFSSIGMVGGAQGISIGNGCEVTGIVIHEIMHAIGFYHEQSRLDRDTFIKINWNNISPLSKYNFHKYNHGQADYWGEKYDLKSVMQYGNYAFSSNSKKTIEVIGDKHRVVGQRDGFSQADVRQINRMYKCGNTRPTPKAVTVPPCQDTRKECPSWAKLGHCQTNNRYMVVGCPVSCGICKGVITPTTPSPGGCVDNYGSCQGMVNQGKCQSDKAYMTLWCKKSCNFCPTSTCTDLNKTCPVWAKDGHCKINPSYMLKNCKQSCSVC